MCSHLMATHEILENWSKKQRLVKNAVFPLLHVKSFFPSLMSNGLLYDLQFHITKNERIQILVKFHITSEKD